MDIVQPGILEKETQLARYITQAILNEENISHTLGNLIAKIDISTYVFGLGNNIIRNLDGKIPNLRSTPTYAVGELEIPSTPDDLWIWLRGNDRFWIG